MKRFLSWTLIGVAVVIVAACSSGASGGGAVAASIDPDALTVSAKDLKFSTSTLSAPADEPFQIAFDNQEGAPHNVAIYLDSSAAEKIFGEDPISGPTVVVYEVPALAVGTYFFRCDVHPEMSGELTAG
jgi:plastocyanin